ncbi:cyclin-dependent protein kinase complex component [Aspergillus heteromorphus CBS 117.55]|uniref:Cyclin-dependent protein kinase complex component n=1 Tax=Aspergillus heteromorphus CBS 117.55 TaxID=1448321 RepID=A0A317VBE6_9EURO|nr:cyclin-dependent protein kinase complex component [Aspergillus heteromorphus CBS 117.55]PWY70397.1 cyclin-dependent protein kinase complex component [Aspergillus heteromorphus CBS 117.55]
MNRQSLPTFVDLTEASDPSCLPNQNGSESRFKYKVDVFQISPTYALELLCTGIEMLVCQTAEEASHFQAPSSIRTQGDSMSSGESTPIKFTELHFSPTNYDGVSRDMIQQSVLSKRFFSKRQPLVTLEEYLLRLHQFCPMSTGVYLATSMYIMRMATVERVINVSRRNMHRLVLAGIQVAMKTLEDLSYPHSRIAKVGGVTERELSKLEISFCFLADFELRVDAKTLVDQVRLLQGPAVPCEDHPQ